MRKSVRTLQKLDPDKTVTSRAHIKGLFYIDRKARLLDLIISSPRFVHFNSGETILFRDVIRSNCSLFYSSLTFINFIISIKLYY